jgi:hypothetical protein
MAANDFTVRELFAERIRSFLHGVMLDEAPVREKEESSA